MIPLLLGMAAEDLKEGRLTVLAKGEKVVNFGNTNSDCGPDNSLCRLAVHYASAPD